MKDVPQYVIDFENSRYSFLGKVLNDYNKLAKSDRTAAQELIAWHIDEGRLTEEIVSRWIQMEANKFSQLYIP